VRSVVHEAVYYYRSATILFRYSFVVVKWPATHELDQGHDARSLVRATQVGPEHARWPQPEGLPKLPSKVDSKQSIFTTLCGRTLLSCVLDGS
jgi:hypothetical protein